MQLPLQCCFFLSSALFIRSKMYYKCSFHVNEGIMKSPNRTTEKQRSLLMKAVSWHI